MPPSLHPLLAGAFLTLLCSPHAPAGELLLPALPPAAVLENRARQEAEKLMSQIQLNDRQKEEARPLLEEMITRGHALFLEARNGLDDADTQMARLEVLMQSRKELQALRHEADERLGRILSPGQMREMKRLRTELRADLKKEFQQRKTTP